MSRSSRTTHLAIGLSVLCCIALVVLTIWHLHVPDLGARLSWDNAIERLVALVAVLAAGSAFAARVLPVRSDPPSRCPVGIGGRVVILLILLTGCWAGAYFALEPSRVGIADATRISRERTRQVIAGIERELGDLQSRLDTLIAHRTPAIEVLKSDILEQFARLGGIVRDEFDELSKEHALDAVKDSYTELANVAGQLRMVAHQLYMYLQELDEAACDFTRADHPCEATSAPICGGGATSLAIHCRCARLYGQIELFRCMRSTAIGHALNASSARTE